MEKKTVKKEEKKAVQHVCDKHHAELFGLTAPFPEPEFKPETRPAKPQEKCPVCGREFERDGSYWECFGGDTDRHIISGPLNDPTGEKIDAMVRVMRQERPKMTLAEMRERMARINKAQVDDVFMDLAINTWATEIRAGEMSRCYIKQFVDPDYFITLLNKYRAHCQQIIAEESAALGVEAEQ